MSETVQAGEFVTYRKFQDPDTGEIYLLPYAAKLVHSYAQWENGKPVGLPSVEVTLMRELTWPETYGGHAAWVGEQISKRREQIKKERARRAARKAAPAFEESSATAKEAV